MVLHKVTFFHSPGDKIPKNGSIAQWMTWTSQHCPNYPFSQYYAGGSGGIGKGGWYGLPYSAQGQSWHPGSSQLNCTLGCHTLLYQLLGYGYILCPVIYRKWWLLFCFVFSLYSFSWLWAVQQWMSSRQCWMRGSTSASGAEYRGMMEI